MKATLSTICLKWGDEMKITLQEYIKNPSGGNAVSQRGLYHDFYAKKFDALILRENGKLDYTLYNNGEKYLIHFKIPSETIEKFYYDVVFEFSPRNADVASSPTLNNYYVKFFSNDPSFIFTFAYVFLKNDLVIDDLKSKIGAKPSKEAPKKTNPQRIVGYVKSFYFAYLFMKAKGLFNKVVFRGNGKKYFKTPFLLKIESAQSKIDKRIELQKEKNKAARVARRLERNEARANNTLNNVVHGKGIRRTPTVKTTRSISRVKSSRVTKRK